MFCYNVLYTLQNMLRLEIKIYCIFLGTKRIAFINKKMYGICIATILRLEIKMYCIHQYKTCCVGQIKMYYALEMKIFCLYIATCYALQ